MPPGMPDWITLGAVDPDASESEAYLAAVNHFSICVATGSSIISDEWYTADAAAACNQFVANGS